MEVRFWISIVSTQVGLIIDPIMMEAAKSFILKPNFAGKFYTKCHLPDSVLLSGKQAFDSANSGLAFQSAQYLDRYSPRLLLLFYADKMFSG
jgi:hypothetical protein